MLRKLTLTVAVVLLLAVALGGATGQAAQTRQAIAPPPSPYQQALRAVCFYFGKHCSDAMRVTKCETGGTYSVWAHNGQYHGIFQMGKHERATYGDSNDVWGQAKAAHAYFIASGSDWSPWSCKPY